MSSLKEKSLKGLFWDFTGRIGLQGVGFFVSEPLPISNVFDLNQENAVEIR